MDSIRPCGGCTACCSVFGVHEIGKEPWTVCEHLVKEKGCKIYGKRPQMCQEFFCLWQGGTGRDEDRPDKLGVIFAPTNGPTEFTGEEEFQAYELHPKAFLNAQVVCLARAMTEINEKLIVGHKYGGKEFTFMGPQAKIKAAQDWVREQS